MIAIIRIAGNVNIDEDVKETFRRLKLKKKYTCVVVHPNHINKGMIKKIDNFVSYGEIKKETFEKLIEKRAKIIGGKKADMKNVVDNFTKGKKFEELGLVPFFTLHPPRKGIESKKHFGVGKGVLGNNKEKINELIERML